MWHWQIVYAKKKKEKKHKQDDENNANDGSNTNNKKKCPKTADWVELSQVIILYRWIT